MAAAHGHRSGGARHDRDGGEGHGNDRGEEYDDPGAHKQIERNRFRGGLPATSEMYARAREQWYRLPGSLVRPSMDPVVDQPAKDEPHHSGHPHKHDKGGGR